MRAVIDASAAVYAALNPMPGLLDEVEVVSVPDLYTAEITNALWKQHQFGGTDLAICEAAVEICLGFPNSIVPATLLYREAFFLARTAKHSVYDMFYIALALREGATLYTKDKALKRLAQRYNVAVA